MTLPKLRVLFEEPNKFPPCFAGSVHRASPPARPAARRHGGDAAHDAGLPYGELPREPSKPHSTARGQSGVAPLCAPPPRRYRYFPGEMAVGGLSYLMAARERRLGTRGRTSVGN